MRPITKIQAHDIHGAIFFVNGAVRVNVTKPDKELDQMIIAVDEIPCNSLAHAIVKSRAA